MKLKKRKNKREIKKMNSVIQIKKSKKKLKILNFQNFRNPWRKSTKIMKKINLRTSKQMIIQTVLAHQKWIQVKSLKEIKNIVKNDFYW